MIGKRIREYEFLAPDDLAHLTRVIGEAERLTSGEIKLVIARSSPADVDALTRAILILYSIVISVLWVVDGDVSEWSRGTTLAVSASAVVLFSLVYVRWFNRGRGLETKAERKMAARRRAELEFYREGLSGTRGRTGILLFLSLREREAVVLADEGIAARVPPDTWHGVLDLILAGARSGRPRVKLDEAIRLCGRLLAEHFPAAAGDQNELPDTVVIKD